VAIYQRMVRPLPWSRVGCDYSYPTTDDILHARIQTMGVAEHQFEVPLHGRQVTWHLYDVGGARGQRHSWVPYFDDANAIIFVAPISAFDQVSV
jgi:guanine nucleotide-binding protein alpha-1 subunit